MAGDAGLLIPNRATDSETPRGHSHFRGEEFALLKSVLELDHVLVAHDPRPTSPDGLLHLAGSVTCGMTDSDTGHGTRCGVAWRR